MERGRDPPPVRILVVVLSVGLLWCSPALAQSIVPPDVVVTRSGEMARGTVMEVVPGERVVLALPDGSSRTFVAGDVEYAGPEALAPVRPWMSAARLDAPVLSPALEDTPGARARIAIAGTEGLFIGASSSDVPALHLCLAPCTTALDPGVYRFGVVQDGSFRLERAGHTVAGPAVLALSYSDRGGLRIAGATVLFVTIVSSIVGVVGSILSLSQAVSPVGLSLLASAGVSLSLLFGVGVPLAALDDHLSVELLPTR